MAYAPPSLEASRVPMPEVASDADAITSTPELYHPFFPAVPLTDKSMEGVVVSMEIVVEELEKFPA